MLGCAAVYRIYRQLFVERVLSYTEAHVVKAITIKEYVIKVTDFC